MSLALSEGFPRSFGPYLLLSSLGRGGMGEVFLAKKRAVSDIDRLCIIKTLRGDLAEHQEYVRRFMDEARIVVQLNHSNICQVYESGRIGPDYYLSMEYVSGVNLKDLAGDLAHRNLKFPPGLAIYVGEQMCEALGYAHRLKSPMTGEHLRVVHRDVSPANVMVSFEGEVKLIDFGLAESTLKTEQTETRLVMGKVAYMAPEQARGEEIDGSVDEFAAAIVIYEALTGDRFYGDMNTHQVWQVVGLGGFHPRMWVGLEPEVRAVLARALDANRSKRFASCEAFRAALEEVRATQFPRSSRAALRELMTATYGDRIEAEQDLIASFADLRAPDASQPTAVAGRAPELTQKNPPASVRWDPGTEPWRSSASDSQRVATTGQQSRSIGDTMSSPSASAPASPTVTPVSEPTGRSEVMTLPANSAARSFVAWGIVVVVAAVAAVVLWPKKGAEHLEHAVDAGAAVVVVAPIVDAGSTAPVVAVPVIVDAGVVAVAHVVDAGQAPVSAEVHPQHTKHNKVEPKNDKPKVVEQPKVVEPAKVEPPKVVEQQKVVDKPKVEDRPLSDLEAEQIVRRCVGTVDCAQTMLEELTKIADPAKYKSRHTLLQFCAAKCRQKGVK